MSRLKVKLRGAILAEVHLENDRQYVAGRKEDCDIRLQPEKGISREHFRLSLAEGIWQVDLLARFGDIINQGTKVNTLKLQHGTQFSVPPYEFEFLEGVMEGNKPSPKPRTAISPTTDLQSVRQFGEVHSSVNIPSPSSEASGDIADIMNEVSPLDGAIEGAQAESTFEAPNENTGTVEKTIVGVAPSVPYLKVIGKDGLPKEMLRLEGGNSWVAGRDTTCSIQIKDARVSRRQFEIRKISGQYMVIDLGSVNGTLLNGTPISAEEPVSIKSGDAILVLDNLYYFELHDPDFKHRLEGVYVPPAPPPEAIGAEGGIGDGSAEISQLMSSQSESQSVDVENILKNIPAVPNAFVENQEEPSRPNETPQEIPQTKSESPDPIPEISAQQAYSGTIDSSQVPQIYQPPVGASAYQNPSGGAAYQAYQSQAPYVGPFPGADASGGVPGFGDLGSPPPSNSNNKKILRLALVLVVTLIVGYIVYDEMFAAKKENKPNPQAAQQNGGDGFKPLTSFDALTEAEKSQVAEFFNQAKNLCGQEKYHECKQRIDSIHAILPEGYQDSKKLLERAVGFIDAEEFQRKEEERQKASAEDKAAIDKVVAECRKLINPKITLAEVETCLAEADRRNPTDPGVTGLKTEASNIESNRKLDDEEKERFRDQAKILEKKFKDAEEIHRNGFAFKAMEAYRKVVKAEDLPDPKKLRAKSEERIVAIREKIEAKTKSRIDEAEKSYKEGQLKEAILSLREALYYDPNNKNLKDKIEQYISDLAGQLKQVYTEAMLEEHFGNIEGGDGRPGAVEKLDEIVHRDIKDGEYYRKAMTKLLNLQRRKPSAN